MSHTRCRQAVGRRGWTVIPALLCCMERGSDTLRPPAPYVLAESFQVAAARIRLIDWLTARPPYPKRGLKAPLLSANLRSTRARVALAMSTENASRPGFGGIRLRFCAS